MNKIWTTAAIIILILVFIGYMVFDVALKKDIPQDNSIPSEATGPDDQWIVTEVFVPDRGRLNAVTISNDGNIFLGGESFLTSHDSAFNLLWEFKTETPVTALSVSGNNVYAALKEIILVFNMRGEKIEEWGPFGNNASITSISSNEFYIAIADATNRIVFILDKEGGVKSLIGKSGEPFIIPSLYFDVALNDESILFVANTGNRRIEKRNIDGTLLEFFGYSGTEPGAFCGCCNPAHFVLVPGGFVTSEKGINRIKMINEKGEFIEFISSVNDFVPSLPLDIATPDGKVIYGANCADSKLYVFRRK